MKFLKRIQTLLIYTLIVIFLQLQQCQAAVPIPGQKVQTQHTLHNEKPISQTNKLHPIDIYSNQNKQPVQNSSTDTKDNKIAPSTAQKIQSKENKKSAEPKQLEKENEKAETQQSSQIPVKAEQTTKKNITQDKLDAYQEIRDNAKFLYSTNKTNDAIAAYKQIPDSEKTSEDWLILSNISQDKEKPDDATYYLKKSIQADDKNYKAHYNLGNIYFSQNKINMALDEYRKVLRIKKDYSYAYYNKGCCYLKKKSWFNARYEFGLAIKSNPNEPAFYYNLAYTYKMLKKDKKAKEALEMYTRLMEQ